MNTFRLVSDHFTSTKRHDPSAGCPICGSNGGTLSVQRPCAMFTPVQVLGQVYTYDVKCEVTRPVSAMLMVLKTCGFTRNTLDPHIAITSGVGERGVAMNGLNFTDKQVHGTTRLFYQNSCRVTWGKIMKNIFNINKDDDTLFPLPITARSGRTRHQ